MIRWIRTATLYPMRRTTLRGSSNLLRTSWHRARGLGEGKSGLVTLSVATLSRSSSSTLSVRTCCLNDMILLSSACCTMWKKERGKWHHHPKGGGGGGETAILGGAAFLPILWVELLTSLRPLGRCFLFSGNQPHPKEGEEGQRRRRPTSPPAREESSTTEREEEGPPLD